MNKKQLNVILMVLILLIAVPFLPWLTHRNTEQLRFGDADPDQYPGSSDTPSEETDPEKDWEKMDEDERQSWLDDLKKNIPSWAEDLLDPSADLDADGIPNEFDPDIDNDGLENDVDRDPQAENPSLGDGANIENFYNAQNKGDLDQIIFTVDPVAPARYWKVRTLENYDRGSGGGSRWSSVYEPLKGQATTYETGVTSAVQEEEYRYTIRFLTSTPGDDFIPTAHHASEVYGTDPEDAVLKVNSVGDFYSETPLQSYNFTMYDYNFSLEQFYSFTLSEEDEQTLDRELEVPWYYNDLGKKEYAVRELAEQLTMNQTGQYNKSMAILAHLKFQYYYNFRSYPAPAEEDPVYFFLFNRTEGVCTHFASSFVMLARLAGIPSRLAMGFALGSIENGERVVKGNNVHAWAEVYFGDMGWVAFEPTTFNVNAGNDNGGNSEGADDNVVGGGEPGGNPAGPDADSDKDGIPDVDELKAGTNPLANDTDGDGLGDGFEDLIDTNPLSNDTDGDGLSDYDEYVILKTDPLDQDSDEDGISDWNEAMGFVFRLGNEFNSVDNFTTTNPIQWDSDSDGLCDGLEIGLIDPQTSHTVLDSNALFHFEPDMDPTTTTHPFLADTDGDNLTDGQEDRNRNGRYDPPLWSRASFAGETDPANPDTDGGGAWDGTESKEGGNPTTSDDDAAYIDSDGDGLTDAEELIGWTISYLNATGDLVSYHTYSDILKADTDDDGLSDGEEIDIGYGGSPTDPNATDTDGDGLEDDKERWKVFITEKGEVEERNVVASPLDYNSDSDGLNDLQERDLGTDPRSNDTDADNPDGLYILDDHLDPFPTVRRYEFVTTYLNITLDQYSVWKLDEELRVEGRLEGVMEGEPVVPENLKIRLYLADIEADPHNLSGYKVTLLGSVYTDGNGEFVFNTDLEDIPVGLYILWGESETSYSKFEQYYSALSEPSPLAVSSESVLSFQVGSTVANGSELAVTVKLRDKGNEIIPASGLVVGYGWNDLAINSSAVDEAGYARFVIPITNGEWEGVRYPLNASFPGFEKSHAYPGLGILYSRVTTGEVDQMVKVLSSRIWLNVSVPELLSVNESFQVTGDLSAEANQSSVNVSGLTMEAIFGERIGSGVIQEDGSFSFLCSFDPASTRPGNRTITFRFPGTELLAEKRVWVKVNIAGTSSLEITAPDTVLRPGNLTIRGQLLDNMEEGIGGQELWLYLPKVGIFVNSTYSNDEGDFQFTLPIVEDHTLGYLDYRVVYRGFGFSGEDPEHPGVETVNFFASSRDWRTKVMAELSLEMNRTQLVRGEDNEITIVMDSMGNHSTIQGKEIYFSFADGLPRTVTTNETGVARLVLSISEEQRPGPSQITLEFPGTDVIRSLKLELPVVVFTRTRLSMEPQEEFRPLLRDRSFTIMGQVENTTQPLRPIRISLYASSVFLEPDAVLEAYHLFGETQANSERPAGNPYIQPLVSEFLTFPEDFSYLGQSTTNLYGNFSYLVNLQASAETGRYFIYAVFNGTNFYFPSSTVISVDIRANTTILLDSSTTPTLGKEMELSLTLLDDFHIPLAGKELTLNYHHPAGEGRAENEVASLETVVSDQDGMVTFRPLLGEKLLKGEQTFEVVFSGDIFYQEASFVYPVTIYEESQLLTRFFDGKNKTVLPTQLVNAATLDGKELQGRDSIREGETLYYTLNLLNTNGDPIPYKKVQLSINGEYRTTIYLDENGSLEGELPVERTLSGWLVFQVSYSGSSDISGNATRMDIQVLETEDEHGFFGSTGFFLLLGFLVLAAAGAAYANFRTDNSAEDEEDSDFLTHQEENRDIIIKEYQRFVDFMRFYGFNITPGKTAREIIEMGNKSVLLNEEKLARITDIFELVRYRDPGVWNGPGQDGEDQGQDTGRVGGFPGDEDVKEIQTLIRAIEDDIEIENIPLQTGEDKFTDGIFDRAKALHGWVNGVQEHFKKP